MYWCRRKPAWTDRILHMGGKNVSVRQSSYSSHPQITMSDHRPVAADFSLSVKYKTLCHNWYLIVPFQVHVYDEDSYRNTYRRLLESLAQIDDSSNRVVEIDTTSVNMGFVSCVAIIWPYKVTYWTCSYSYKRTNSETLKVKNVGKVRFLARAMHFAVTVLTSPSLYRVLAHTVSCLLLQTPLPVSLTLHFSVSLSTFDAIQIPSGCVLSQCR